MLGGIAFQLREYYPLFFLLLYWFFMVSQVVIIVYAFCAGEFFVRYSWKRPIRAPVSSEHHGDSTDSNRDSKGRGEMSHKMQLMVVALCFSTLCLLIRWVSAWDIQSSSLIMNLFLRAIYRTIELADGWDGRIISTEVLFSKFSVLRTKLKTTFFLPLLRRPWRSYDYFGYVCYELCSSRIVAWPC